jgi:hypothetical protein
MARDQRALLWYVDEGTVLKWTLRKWDWGMDWIDLALERDTWWALVDAVMNLRIP